MDFYLFNGVWVFLIWSLEIKSGNLCVAILANFLGNFQKFQTFWNLDFLKVRLKLKSLRTTALCHEENKQT